MNIRCRKQRRSYEAINDQRLSLMSTIHLEKYEVKQNIELDFNLKQFIKPSG